MLLKNKAMREDSGGVIIFVALMLPVLLGVLGITVDVGRSYAVQSKVQNAADAAIMGAVATASSTNVATEATRLFNANFPSGYLGATVNSITVTQPSQGQYLLSISVNVPTSVMKVFGNNNTTIKTTSRVDSGFQLASPQTLELALVFDNSGAANVGAMNTAGQALVNVLFNPSSSLPNVYVHVLPFDVDVDVGSNRVGWIQNAFVASYNQYSKQAKGGKGFISNRNNDAPPNALMDVSDVAPTTDATRFRVPFAYGPPGSALNKGNNPDFVSTNKLVLMQFGMNTKTAINKALKSMKATGGNLRTNVGLMWGWFTLSPNWQGLFNAGLPGLPMNQSPLGSKRLVLVVAGKNNVYTGQPNKSNDDKTTAQLCQAVKSKGIILYTIGFGAAGSYNAAMLQACATGASDFYAAPTPAALTTAFQSIADEIRSSTIQLVQ